MARDLDDIPTVHQVQGGVVIMESGYGLSKIFMARRGGFYGSRDTTEDDGFLLVTLKVTNIFRF